MNTPNDASDTNPSWSDVFTPEELAAALDVHSLRLAKKYGDYSLAADIAHAAEAIRDFAEQQAALTAELATLAGAAMDGVAALDGVKRQIKSGIESLSKQP